MPPRKNCQPDGRRKEILTNITQARRASGGGVGKKRKDDKKANGETGGDNDYSLEYDKRQTPQMNKCK